MNVTAALQDLLTGSVQIVPPPQVTLIPGKSGEQNTEADWPGVAVKAR